MDVLRSWAQVACDRILQLGHNDISMVDPDRLSAAYETARCDLLAESSHGGHWVGQLASSPLATAAAISALSVVDRHAPTLRGRFADETRECRLSELIITSVHWLADRQNADGGWSDAEHGASTVAATLVVRAAFALTAVPASHPGLLERADQFLKTHGGHRALASTCRGHKTLAAAIMANAALAGLVAWRRVPAGNFELDCCGRMLARWFGKSNGGDSSSGDSTVDDASAAGTSAAEIATGLVRHAHRKSWNPLSRLLYRRSLAGNLHSIESQQSPDGGFLESASMTSFIVMYLAASGQADHEIVRRGVEFLLGSVRPDGSWPIAVDMSVRNTALAIGALAAAGEDTSEVGCLEWLLSCQRRRTEQGSEVGGWTWTDRYGGVVNTLDTSAVLVALAPWKDARAAADRSTFDKAVLDKAAFDRPVFDRAVSAAVQWLLAAQNSDGGWPSIGGSLDRDGDDDSRADMTAWALRALARWRNEPVRVSSHSHEVHTYRNDRTSEAIDRGVRYLMTHQNRDGSWSPHPQENASERDRCQALCATAKVLAALGELGRLDDISATGVSATRAAATRALDWIASIKHADGGWGAESAATCGAKGATVEETAWATAALVACGQSPAHAGAAECGLRWLIDAVESNRHQVSAAVGRTLSGLCYDEKLNPLTSTVAALGRQARKTRHVDPVPTSVQAVKP